MIAWSLSHEDCLSGWGFIFLSGMWFGIGCYWGWLTRKWRRRGVWLAYYSDWSAWMVFNGMDEAMRHAVKHHMEVVFLQHGQDPHEVIR